MVEINFENLPAPRGFVIDVGEADLWNYREKESEDDEPTQLKSLFGSDSFQVVYLEMPPGEVLPWHTHEPHTAQLYWILEGTILTKFKDNDGEVHSVEASGEDEELVYIPAGAHNEQENVGDETARFLSFKSHGGTVNGRIEHLVGDPDEHYDPDTDKQPPALDLLPRRGHIFNLDEDTVTEW